MGDPHRRSPSKSAARGPPPPTPRLPGLALPQGVARGLVAAAAALFVTTDPPSPSPATTATRRHPRTQPPPPPPRPHTRPRRDRPRGSHYTVKKGDTLSEIALDQPGKPSQLPRMFQASRATVQPGGRHLTDPDVIDIGWKLTIPDRPTHPTRPPSPTSAPGPTHRAPSSRARPRRRPTRRRRSPPSPPAQSRPAPHRPAGTTPTVTGDTTTRPRVAAQWPVPGPARCWPGRCGSGWPGGAPTSSAAADPDAPSPSHHPISRQWRRPSSAKAHPPARWSSSIDEILRRTVATLTATDGPIPVLAGLDALPDQLTLRLCSAAELCRTVGMPSTPTAAGVADRHRPPTPDSLGPLEDDSAPPWPQLVTLGRDDHGWRLVNLEALGVITLTGDPDYATTWPATSSPNSPSPPGPATSASTASASATNSRPRPRPHPPPHRHRVIDTVIATAVHTVDRLQADDSPNLETARVTYADDELWDSHLLISATTDADHLTRPHRPHRRPARTHRHRRSADQPRSSRDRYRTATDRHRPHPDPQPRHRPGCHRPHP